jgi:hypothetical protein
MRKDAKSKPAVSTVVSSLIVLLTFSYQMFQGWFYLGNRGGFGDLQYVLERVDCQDTSRADLYGVRTADPCTGYIYGSSLLIIFRLLGLSERQLTPVGVTSSLLFLAMILFLLIRCATSATVQIVTIALLFSPPIILLMERSNLDLIIVFLVVTFTALYSRGLYKLSFFFITLSALFKFYTFPLLALPILKLRKARDRFVFLMLVVLIGSIIISDLIQISALPWDARNMFGNAIWGEYLIYFISGPQTHANFAIASGIGILLLASVTFLVHKMNFLKIEITKANNFEARLSQVSILIYVICYFTGLSVDYRLAFLFVAYVASLGFLRPPLMLHVIMLVAFFFSYNSGNFQPIGDGAQLILISVLINSFGKQVWLAGSNGFDQVKVGSLRLHQRIFRNAQFHN